MQNFEIPNASKIQKEISQHGEETLYWYKPNGGIFRYFIGLFLLAWMGGWFFGFKSALDQLIDKPGDPNNSFVMFWLVAWTVGGLFAAVFIYQILRPQKPEKITFRTDHFEYDTGTSSPVMMMFNRADAANSMAPWSKIFQKRKVFSKLQRGQIQLVHEKNPSRIYFDWESKRHEIGSGLSEPDIDWLHSRLSDWSR